MADSTLSVSGAVAVNGVLAVLLNWANSTNPCLSYLVLKHVEVWCSTVNDRATATKVAEVVGNSYLHGGLPSGVTRYYWLRPVDVSGGTGDYTPLSATAGLFATPISTTITSYLTNEAVVVPANSAGVVSDYSKATTQLVILDGVNDVTGSYTIAQFPSNGITANLTGALLTVTNLTSAVDAASINLTATRAGFPTITRTFSVTKTRAGSDLAEDFTPPGTVATPTVTSAVTTSVDGTQDIRMTVTWARNTESDFSYYQLELQEGVGAWAGYAVPNVDSGNVTWALPVKANTAYNVRIRGIDSSANRGNYSVIVPHTTSKDTTPPALPTSVAALANFQTITLQWLNPTVADFKWVEIWENTTNNSGTATLIATSSANFFNRDGLATNSLRYYWLKSVDTSDNKSAFTSAVSATTKRAVEADLADAAVTGAKMAAAAIDATKFASGIEPVGVVSALPSPTGYTGPKVLFNSTDDKMYRYSGTAWTAAVPTADLSGQITSTQITDNAITTPKILANAVTATQVAANAITADKLIANAVTAGKIAAAAVSATQIAANAIIADKIAANAITASKLAIGDTSNIYPDPEMLDPAFYTYDGDATYSQGGTITTTSGQNRIVMNATAAVSSITTGWFQIQPSTQYYFEIWAALISTTDTSVTVTVEWGSLSSTGVVTLLASPVTLINAKATTASTRDHVSATAPSTARRARFKVTRAAGGTAQTTFGLPVCRKLMGSTLIEDGAITTGKIVANAITANEIAAGTITAAKIATGTITANEIGANVITATQIATGTITANELAANTITAAKIAANAITADKLQIGSRNLGFEGVQFSFNKETNVLSWTAGTVTYINDANTATSTAITAGNATWTTGTLYVYWTQGGTSFATTTTAATAIGANKVTVAQYRGGFNLTATFGRTLIDGDEIVTNTLNANRILTGSITATQIAANAISATKLSIGDTSNMYPDPEMLDAAFYTGGTPTGTTISASGRNAVVMAANAAQTSCASGWFPCEPSTQYYAEVLCVALSGTSVTMQAWIDFATMAANGTPTYVTGSMITATSSTAQNRVGINVTSPANVRLARFVAIRLAGGTSTGVFGRPVLRKMSGVTLIEDGAITTSKIVAGAITADRIAANAITATKILVGRMDNLVTDANMFDRAWWGVTDNRDTMATSPTNVFANSQQCLNMSGAGTRDYFSRPFAVEPGGTYRIRGTMWNSVGGSWTSVYLHVPSVEYHNMGQPNLGTNGQGLPIQYNTSGIHSFDFTYTNPTGVAGNANMVWQLRLNCTLMSSGNYALFGDFSVTRVSDATLIQDGAILTNKIAANAITAGKIAANQITAGHIAANQITAGHIATGSINAGHISAGQITADKLAANSVSADKITTGTLGAAVVQVTGGSLDVIDALNGNSLRCRVGHWPGYAYGLFCLDNASAIKFEASANRIWMDGAVIGDLTVTNAKIGNLQVNGAKIADLSASNSVGATATNNNSLGVSMTVTGKPVTIIAQWATYLGSTAQGTTNRTAPATIISSGVTLVANAPSSSVDSDGGGTCLGTVIHTFTPAAGTRDFFIQNAFGALGNRVSIWVIENRK